MTTELRNVCEDESVAVNSYGRAVASVLQTRLADIVAAENVLDILVGNPRYITEDSGSFLMLDLIEGHSLVFSADHAKKTPRNRDKQIVWPEVTYIQLIKIQNNGRF